MTNEERQQLKARFFGQHIGCKCNNGGNLASVSSDKGLYWLTAVYENGATYSDYDLKLILRPLSSITDEEAIECAKIATGKDVTTFDRAENSIRVRLIVDCQRPNVEIFFNSGRIMDDEGFAMQGDIAAYDYLRSKHFCLPFYGLDPIQEGWAILETDTQPNKEFLKLEGNQIYIDASYRRTNLGKWVFVCIGDESDFEALKSAFLLGEDVSKFAAAYQCEEDFRYWQNYFSNLREANNQQTQ